MKIGFDLQPLQTENSKTRGIGRFSLNLLTSILENNPDNSFTLFSNNKYSESINLPIYKNANLIPINYKTDDTVVDNLVQFLTYKNYSLDILQILNPFEGYPSTLPVITSHFDKLNSVVISTIHDLIPLQMPNSYLDTDEKKYSYYKQLKTVYDSDYLFAVSESTKNDIVNLLGISPNRIFVIGEGVSDFFHNMSDLSDKKIQSLKKKFHIKQKFVLYAGGIDPRKNIEKSIIAFSKLSSEVLKETSYVIVCKINPIDEQRLKKLSNECGIEDNLVLTNFVSDEELNLFYNSCDLFIFPSLLEGFGLPVLESMTCGAPVIGSDSSGTFELINNTKFVFDPNNENEITQLIQQILTDQDLHKQCIKNSKNQAKKYSWNSTSKKVTTLYSQLIQNHNKTKISKPKVAYFSPLPPRKSGIADYSSVLIKHLSKYWDIDFFVDNYNVSDQYIASNFSVFSWENFATKHTEQQYDVIIYHFGNSDNHIYMFDMLKKFPGVVVLHDIYLGGVIHWMTAKVGQIKQYEDEIIYSHGEKGQNLLNKAKKGIIPWNDLIWELQTNKRVLDNATHVIVHSEWDKNSILELYPELTDKISIIPIFGLPSTRHHIESNKKQLGFQNDDFLVCTFGFVVPTKKITDILKNIKKFLLGNKNCKFVIVGDIEDNYANEVKQLVKQLGITEQVIFTGFIDDKLYKKYLSACDLAIQLRKNVRGGGSLSITYNLGAGVPTIVSDLPPFSNYPDNVVIKLKHTEENNLSSILNELYSNSEKLDKISLNARNFVLENISPELCAKKYYQTIDSFCNGEEKL